ncbi:hypothetical protein Mapa_015943 [Marchantia paleacea]|nr:hypothetical protein Mapa_015943 [Marchantia paleacea]
MTDVLLTTDGRFQSVYHPLHRPVLAFRLRGTILAIVKHVTERNPRSSFLLSLLKQGRQRQWRSYVQILIEIPEQSPFCNKTDPIQAVIDDEVLSVSPCIVQSLPVHVDKRQVTHVHQGLEHCHGFVVDSCGVVHVVVNTAARESVVVHEPLLDV